MSTNLNCEFIEIRRNQWYYILEDGSAPKNAWDWREYAQATGPFPTTDAANEHLHEHHANPGGSMTQALPDGVDEVNLSKDAVLAKLIEDAHAPDGDRYQWRSAFRFR